MRVIQIDGSFGEGGGQILRSSLALAALTGRPLEIFNIRAGRSKPGLRPQHLTAVRAVSALCSAELHGDALNSQRLVFRPAGMPAAGDYHFDVQQATKGGSAGSMTLMAQAILLPLAFAAGLSHVRLEGGTHVPWSPPFHYMRDVFFRVLGRIGLQVEAELKAWGWYPVGRGEFSLTVQPVRQLKAIEWVERGELIRVTGVAAVTNLPAHIPQRMANRARNLLHEAGISNQIEPVRARGAAAGAGIFLIAEYSHGRVGFSALGKKGKAAEFVAEDACAALLKFHQESEAAVDPYLADQLVLPLALAEGKSTFSTNQITQHTLTNIHIVQQFLELPIRVDQGEGGGLIQIEGMGYCV